MIATAVRAPSDNWNRLCPISGERCAFVAPLDGGRGVGWLRLLDSCFHFLGEDDDHGLPKSVNVIGVDEFSLRASVALSASWYFLPLGWVSLFSCSG